MVVEKASTPKNGRPRAVTLDAVLDAATELADDQGLDAVSFRALADRLGVSPMAIHRTTGGIDALQHALVSRIVGEVTRSVDWPDDWRGIVRLFADTLHDLLMRHPVVLEAHRRASLVGPGADDVAYRV
ncbi:helix-turn-helix domain-containing protein, partial [Streptomyces sp. NPDC088135]